MIITMQLSAMDNESQVEKDDNNNSVNNNNDNNDNNNNNRVERKVNPNKGKKETKSALEKAQAKAPSTKLTNKERKEAKLQEKGKLDKDPKKPSKAPEFEIEEVNEKSILLVQKVSLTFVVCLLNFKWRPEDEEPIEAVPDLGSMAI